MHLSSIVAAAAILLSCTAAPAPVSSKHILHEKRNGEPHQWRKRSRADKDYLLPIRIGLRQQNLENADKYIYDVADPKSPNFGEWIW